MRSEPELLGIVICSLFDVLLADDAYSEDQTGPWIFVLLSSRDDMMPSRTYPFGLLAS